LTSETKVRKLQLEVCKLQFVQSSINGDNIFTETKPSRIDTSCTCREVVAEYCKEVRKLVLKILEAISESLGLEGEYLNKALGSHGQHMAINYYPPCPQPELTYGLPGHKDPNVITVLLQDGVPGLQVLRDGKWVGVNPNPDALIINIGD